MYKKEVVNCRTKNIHTISDGLSVLNCGGVMICDNFRDTFTYEMKRTTNNKIEVTVFCTWNSSLDSRLK